MRIERNGELIVLSKRNLLTLLQKLEEPISARSIMIYDRGRVATVKAEPDEIHYQARTPGAMNEKIMSFIESFNRWRRVRQLYVKKEVTE